MNPPVTEPLFPLDERPAPTDGPSNIRAALEAELGGQQLDLLSGSGVAMLRSLADQCDALDAWLRVRDAKPRDWAQYAQLVAQFDATSERVLGESAGAGDSFANALAEFRSSAAASSNPA